MYLTTSPVLNYSKLDSLIFDKNVSTTLTNYVQHVEWNGAGGQLSIRYAIQLVDWSDINRIEVPWFENVESLSVILKCSELSRKSLSFVLQWKLLQFVTTWLWLRFFVRHAYVHVCMEWIFGSDSFRLSLVFF